MHQTANTPSSATERDTKAAADRRSEALAALKAEGLTIGECIRALASPEDDPYIRKARQLINGSDDVEIDEESITAPGDDGAWVLTWTWVSNEEAGILRYSDLFDKVLERARRFLSGYERLEHCLPAEQKLDAETRALRTHQADWLEDLISNYADELDGIETEILQSTPGPIVWDDGDGNLIRFMPSDALYQLLSLARRRSLSIELSNQAEKFCMQFGNKLDAVLTVLQTGQLSE